MKKFISGFLIGAMLFGTIGAFAAQYIANPVSFKVMVNGEEFVSDPPALEVEGRTYLPLRAIGEALGVPVNWNQELNQAEVGSVPNPVSLVDDVVSNDKWKLTYLNYKTYSEVNYFKPVTEGNKFLAVFFELENLTSDDQSFGLSPSYYIDDYKVKPVILGDIDGASEPILGIKVSAGKKAKIFLAFEVSPNWSKFNMEFAELFESDNSKALRFNLTR